MKLTDHISKRKQDIFFLEDIVKKAERCLGDIRQVQLRLIVNLFGRAAFQQEISWAEDVIQTIRSGGLHENNSIIRGVPV